jgi:glucokinase
MKVFAGDIGGTKTLLQIADVAEGHYQVIYEQRFESQRYDDFLPLAQNFLASAPHSAVAAIEDACIAVAGPVASTKAGQHAKVTNLPWQIEARSLAATLHLPRLLLINDFQAIGHAVDALGSEDFVVLQAGKCQPRAPRIIIGAGTGLGVAQMIWQAGRYHIIPSEGGHADFAPADETQMALLRYMQSNLSPCMDVQEPPHVSYDRILCGPGLVQIYKFLQAQTTREAAAYDAAALSAAASTDPVARAALDLFVSIYGAQAGNLALFNLADGGVYVAGGIAPKILPYMQAGGFMRAFCAKGRMAGLMAAMPVSIITNAKVGVMGAVRAAAGL